MQQPKQYAITLTADELNLVGMALGELPLKVSGHLHTKIRTQYEAQENPPPAETKPVDPPKPPVEEPTL